MPVDVQLIDPTNIGLLDRVVAGVFHAPVSARWLREFMNAPHHYLVVAYEQGWVVGMASAVHAVHPDRASQFRINEVGVAPTHLGRGIGEQLMATLLAQGRKLGYREAWVAAEETNLTAQGLYVSAGGVANAERSITYTFPLK